MLKAIDNYFERAAEEHRKSQLIVCPYCENEHEPESEDYGGQDEENTFICGNCDEEFIYTTNYLVTFESKKLESEVKTND